MEDPHNEVESWRVVDARAAKRNEARLFGNEDDKCNNCGNWTIRAADRLSLDADDNVCACDASTLAMLGSDADFPDLWADNGTTRVVPFTNDMLDIFPAGRRSEEEVDQEAGAVRAEQMIWRWASTAKEKAFLEGLAAGLTQGEAARESGLMRPDNLLRRIRAETEAWAA